MGKRYTVIEMQDGQIGGNHWTYEARADAEVKMYQVLSEVVKSEVPTHTVQLQDERGQQLFLTCYDHGSEA